MVALSSLVSGVFTLTGVWHLLAGAGCATGGWRQRADSAFHVLMSCAMLAMLWPGQPGGAVPAAAQVMLFAAGSAWFLLTPGARSTRWYDAVAMAAMVWMLLVMDRSGSPGADAAHAHHSHTVGAVAHTAAGPGWHTLVTLAFVAVLMLGVVHSLGDWIARQAERAERRSTAPVGLGGLRSLVAALMGAAMMLSLLPLL